MRPRARAAVVAAVLLLTAGCRNGSDNRLPTPFFRDFSLAHLLHDPDLGIRFGAGMTIGSDERETSWRGRRFFHRDETADLSLAAGAEEAFLNAVGSLVQDRIHDAGLEVREAGGSAGLGHLYFAYDGASSFGWVDLWGVPKEQGEYRLLAILSESQVETPSGR